jgi:hypothetical protein
VQVSYLPSALPQAKRKHFSPQHSCSAPYICLLIATAFSPSALLLYRNFVFLPRSPNWTLDTRSEEMASGKKVLQSIFSQRRERLLESSAVANTCGFEYIIITFSVLMTRLQQQDHVPANKRLIVHVPWNPATKNDTPCQIVMLPLIALAH